jgi:putative ABC transport system substrate-binding protein
MRFAWLVALSTLTLGILAAPHTVASADQPLLELQSLTVRESEDFDDAFMAVARGRAEALLAVDGSLTLSYRARLVQLAAKRRLRAMDGFREFTDAGGLLSYGTHVVGQYRRTASFVDEILKGAKPADLPVEQPTRFEFVINPKTAKALGLTIPPSVLARADELIQ